MRGQTFVKSLLCGYDSVEILDEQAMLYLAGSWSALMSSSLVSIAMVPPNKAGMHSL